MSPEFPEFHIKKAAGKVKAWPVVRESLLRYLENGEPPWNQKGWPLPDSGLDLPEPERKEQFPMVSDLIEIAILEKKPERVLYWYDRLPKKQFGWYGVNDDEVATTVQTHARKIRLMEVLEGLDDKPIIKKRH